MSSFWSDLVAYFTDAYTFLLNTLGFETKTGNLLLIGLDNAGKTTLLNKLITGAIHLYTPTLRPLSSTITIGGVKLSVTDVGGHEGVRHLWSTHTAGVDGVVFVVDSADSKRWPEARDELQALLRLLARQHQELPVAVIGNKTDLADAADAPTLWDALGMEGRYVEGAVVVHGRLHVRLFMASLLESRGYLEPFSFVSEHL
jgi:GTP-binding protein SAR1